MKRFVQSITVLLLIPLLLFLPLVPQQAQAAEFRSGDVLRITGEEPIVNPYIFGGNIQIDAPIANELTAAGGDIVINSPIEGSALVAGGSITLRGSVGNNARIAGGNILIDGPVENDLVISGGSVNIARSASIGGDIVFNGGSLTVDAPVAGKMIVNGGNATINNSVGGDVSGEIGKLVLGSDATITGNLSYKSPERAQIDQGATVSGRTDYRPSEDRQADRQDAQEFITTAALYKLIADIIVTVLFIYFFRRALTAIIRRMQAEPLRSGVIGFGFAVLTPIAGLLLLTLIWLGLVTLLFYGLVYIIALFILKVFLGWLLLHWWGRNQKRDYALDWKAGIVGPVVVLILSLIPILGWLTLGIIFLIGLGAMIQELTNLSANQRVLNATTTKTTTKPTTSKRK
jgi:hypothetical protein